MNVRNSKREKFSKFYLVPFTLQPEAWPQSLLVVCCKLLNFYPYSVHKLPGLYVADLPEAEELVEFKRGVLTNSYFYSSLVPKDDMSKFVAYRPMTFEGYSKRVFMAQKDKELLIAVMKEPSMVLIIPLLS